jgi:hypothetical protein
VQTIDSTYPTFGTVPSRPSTPRAAAGATPCTRRPSRVPPRRSARVFTAGQLASEEYARAVIEARASGTWL